jgi:hypothetical protein
MIEVPLWARWVLAIVLFAGLGIGAYFVAHGHDSTAPTEDALGTVEANREGQIVVRQDQAPHQTRFGRTASPRQALVRAIAADVRARIASHNLTGPLETVRCSSAPSRRRGREPFVCTVTSASIGYTFYGVADQRARTLTWCKQDAVALAGLSVPLSPRCLS